MKNNFFNTIESALKNVPGNQSLAIEFLSDRSNITRFVIGKNEQSSLLINNLKIDGVIDDFEQIEKFWEKAPIIKSRMIPENAIVVNCSTSISPNSVTKNLLAAGVKKLLNFNELVYASNGSMSMPLFVEQMRMNFSKYSNEWFNIYQILSDQKSKDILLDIIRYRLTADASYMQLYSIRLNDQYFEEFMHYDSETFADIGGFDGDTTEEFCKRVPNYKKIFFYEPSFRNMEVAKNRLAEYSNIDFFPFGLSDTPGTLSFNTEAGSASAVTEVGSTKIDVTTLDIKIKEPISFIKMDIEGWELKALFGCKNHIIKDKPKLAIAVYHSAKDFYEIPNYILSLNPDYDIYLRHYTEGWSETVMYFFPKSSK